MEEALNAYSLLFDELLPVTPEVTRIALALIRGAPQRLPLVDALIAATALLAEATLVHRDQHLARLPSDRLRQRDLDAEALPG